MRIRQSSRRPTFVLFSYNRARSRYDKGVTTTIHHRCINGDAILGTLSNVLSDFVKYLIDKEDSSVASSVIQKSTIKKPTNNPC